MEGEPRGPHGAAQRRARQRADLAIYGGFLWARHRALTVPLPAPSQPSLLWPRRRGPHYEETTWSGSRAPPPRPGGVPSCPALDSQQHGATPAFTPGDPELLAPGLPAPRPINVQYPSQSGALRVLPSARLLPAHSRCEPEGLYRDRPIRSPHLPAPPRRPSPRPMSAPHSAARPANRALKPASE